MIKDTVDNIRTRIQDMKERATSANEHLVLDEVLQQIEYASGDEDSDARLIEAAQCAWFEAALRFVGGAVQMPFVPARGNSRWLPDGELLVLTEFFLARGPDWTTGHGALEAIDHLVECALANGNLDNWDHGPAAQLMSELGIKVVSKRRLTGKP